MCLRVGQHAGGSAGGLEEVLRECRRCRGSGGSALGHCYVLGRWSKCFEGGGRGAGSVEEILREWKKCRGSSGGD